MVTAIDTNILLDILIPNTKYSASSKNLLDECYQRGALIINEVVYAELATQFDSQEELKNFLEDTGIRLETSNPQALYRASQAWRTYNLKREEKFQCPQCGQKHKLKCTQCGEILSKRQHILSDFLIGGHALEQAHSLATRDRGYYHTYFKKLKLESP